MKRFLLVLALLSMMGALFAHAPSLAGISYDPDTKLLTVNVNHNIGPTGDPTRHFTKEGIIMVNGVQAVLQNYTFQENNKGMTIVSRLILKSGDKVDVKVKCSFVGEGNSTYTVP